MFPKAAYQSNLREVSNRLFGYCRRFNVIDILSQGQLPDSFHDFSKFDPPRATDRTGITSCTDPGCFGRNNLIFQTKVGQNHNPPGWDIHVFNHRASTRTHTTLHAFVKIFAADLLDFLYEFLIIGFIRDFDSQWSTSLLFGIVKLNKDLLLQER